MKSKLALTVAVFIVVIIGSAIFLFKDRHILQRDTKLESVRMVYLPIAPDLPFFVAMDQNFFNEEGLQIEAIQSKKSDEALEILFTGRADATDIMELYALVSHEQVKPGSFKIYLMGAAEESTKVHKIIVRRSSGITSLGQLSGKKLGHFPGTQMKMFNILLLKQFMRDPEKEVTFVNVPPDNQIPFLESGAVDAIFSLEPIGTEAVLKGVADELVVNPLYKYIQQPFPASASVISSELIRQRPSVAKKIVNAIEKAVAFIESNPDEAKKSLVKWTHISLDVAEKVGIYRYWTLSRINKDAFQRYANLLLQNGLTDSQVQTSSMYYGQ